MSAPGPTKTAANIEQSVRSDLVSDAPVRSEADVDRGSVEGYEYWVEARRAHALRRERGLVEEFCGFLERRGQVLTAFEIRTANEVIFCDLYDSSRHILFEAKADALVRAEIRMAIGQLFDYSVAGFSEAERKELKLAVLLPHRPKPDIEHLLDVLRIGIAWREEAGLFHEEYPA